MRPALAVIALSAAIAASPGCTIEDGRGWATLSATVSGSLAVDAEHASDVATFRAIFAGEGGSIVAAFDVNLSVLAATLARVELLETVGAAASGGGTFDPAHPPAGYSLCHGGHCHNAEGGLESYEEIQAKMSGGGTESGSRVAASLAGGSTLNLLAGASVDLGSHEVDTFRLSGVRVVLSGFELAADVRIDGTDVPLRIDVAEEVRLSAEVAASVGQGGLEEPAVAVVVSVPAGLLDGIRLDYLSRDTGPIRVDATHNDTAFETVLARLALLVPAVSAGGE